MPSNIEHENISAIKLGIVDMTKGYIGHEEVYPNSTQIQSAVFTDTSNLSYTGGTRVFRVTGEAGSTFNVSASNGSGGGSYTLGNSPEDINISVSSVGCTGSSRTITGTLTPTGSTVLQGGGSTFVSSFTQNAGPGITNYTGTFNVSVTEVSKTTTTINGVTYYAAPTVWDVTYTWNFGGLTASYIIISEQGLGMYNSPNHPDYMTNNLASLTGGSSQIQMGSSQGWPSGASGASGNVTVRWTSNQYASDGTTLLDPIIGYYRFSATAYSVVGSCQTFNGSSGSPSNNATIYP
jgi:hypothetical protein